MYEETRKRIYRLLASNYAGLENISEDGKKTMVAVEKKASEFALNLLRTAMDEETRQRQHIIPGSTDTCEKRG